MDIHPESFKMNAEASSSSHTREHTHLNPLETESGSIKDQAQELATQKEQEIEDAINLLELRNNQPQTHSRPRTQPQPLPRPNKGPVVDQSRLDLQEGVYVENKIKLVGPINNQPQPQPELEEITLEARLAKKDKQLEAARKELCKIEGEKTKLKQEVVSPQPKHKLISGWSRRTTIIPLTRSQSTLSHRATLMDRTERRISDGSMI
jgi:hypothetical protein